MEILKNLSYDELNDLRDVFQKNKHKSLSRREFRRALRAASTGKELPFRITKAYLNHLFSSVDVAGDERVTWGDFSMYVVEQARTAAEITIPYKDQIVSVKKTKMDALGGRGGADEDSESSPSDDDDDLQSRRQLDATTAKIQIAEGRGKDYMEEFGAVRQYHVDGLEVNPMGVKLVDMRLLPRTTRLVKVTENLKGQRALTLHEDAEKFPVVGTLPRRIEPFSCWEHIPNTGGIKYSNSIASAYGNGIVQIFELPDTSEVKRSSEFLTCMKTMHMPDTQTSMQWSSLYGRLMMGSSNGIVSVWDVDTDHLASQERLHMLTVTNCRLRSNYLYTSSLDRFDSVKAVDLEKSVVVYSFSDHIVGGALTLSVDNEYIISSGCEIKIVLRSVQAPNANFMNLYDCVTPHQGRITAVHRLPATPLLISGDSRGNLKIWDLRMNSCVQTFPASSFGYVKKSVASSKKPMDAMLLPPISGGGGGAVKEREKDSDDASQVTAICPMPKLGLVSVGTGSHRYTLTALDAAFPDRVDDEIPCRFILVPNASQLLTVHGSYFKLWNITTGHTIYTSKIGTVHGDITACTLVEPLKRQMVCGTIEGDLKGFTVSLGKRVFNFFPALRDSESLREDRPIISLDTIPNFRDQPMPYVIITYEDSVVMLPIMPHVRADHLVRLHVVTGLLEDHQHTIKETRYEEKQLFVALSNNTVHLVDLHFNTVTATYRLPTPDLDNIFVGVTTEGSYRRMDASFSSKRRMHATTVQSFFFAADGSGNVMCGKGVHYKNVEDVAGNHMNLRRLIIGLWNTGEPDSWKPAQRAQRRSSARRSRSSNGGDEEDSPNNSESFLPKIPPGASPAITHMFFFGLFSCLVTGDERGNVKLWDMGGVLARNTPTLAEESIFSRRVSGQASTLGGRRHSLMPPLSPATASAHHIVPTTSTTSSKPLGNSLDNTSGGDSSLMGYPPVVVSAWHAHSHGFTSLGGLDHPHLMLPVVLTGGPDYHLLMWSCDGYAIGSFATGRQIDDTSGGRRFGLLPYCFQQSPADLTLKWEKFLEYYRGNPGRKLVVEMEEVLPTARSMSDRTIGGGNSLAGEKHTYHPMPLRRVERGMSMSVMESAPQSGQNYSAGGYTNGNNVNTISANKNTKNNNNNNVNIIAVGGENPLYVTEPHLHNNGTGGDFSQTSNSSHTNTLTTHYQSNGSGSDRDTEEEEEEEKEKKKDDGKDKKGAGPRSDAGSSPLMLQGDENEVPRLTPLRSPPQSQQQTSHLPHLHHHHTNSGAGFSEMEKLDSPSSSTHTSPSLFTRENSERGFLGNRQKSEESAPFWDKGSRNSSPSISRPNSGESGNVSPQTNGAGGPAGIVKPQYRLGYNLRQQQKRFRLARTGACAKSASHQHHHRLPALNTTAPQSTDGSAATTNGNAYVPAMVPSSGPAHLPTDLGNGVLEVRVRQQSILGGAGFSPLHPAGAASSPHGRHPHKGGNGDGESHQGQSHHPSSPTSAHVHSRTGEVSARVVREEVDVTVNVHGKVQAAKTKPRRQLRGPRKNEGKQAALATLFPHS